MSKQGTLLCNLGSPSSTSVSDVRSYLGEFLSDPRVIDIPTPLRKLVVNAFILPFRPKDSAEAYRKIWKEGDAPLIRTTKKVSSLLRQRVDMPVTIGMRYGEPSIASGLETLDKQGVDDLFFVPLYPHYAMSSYETAVAEVQKQLREGGYDMELTIQPPFYNDPDYIDALLAKLEPYLEADYDHIVFSYHGLPKRHITKGDPSGCYCLEMEDCCRKPNPVHGVCYRHQVFSTTWELVERTDIPEDKYTVAFQSRLSPDTDPWLEPKTDETIEKLGEMGDVDKLVVISPAFVADCLETLEELAIEGKEDFLEAGGESFELVPCLNDSPEWIDVLEKFVDNFSNGTLKTKKDRAYAAE